MSDDEPGWARPTDPWGNPLPDNPSSGPPGPANPPAQPPPPGSWWGDDPGQSPPGWTSDDLPAPPGSATTPPMAIIALVLAIAGFIVCGIFLSPLAAYLGYRVRNQIDRTGAQGRGLATAAIVVGIVGFLLNLVVVIVVITSPDFLSDLEGALT